MTQLEELEACLDQLEEKITDIALALISFRRVVKELRGANPRRPDFDYRTGMPPKEN